jgi:uncharacterized protein (TIGR02246 family)
MAMDKSTIQSVRNLAERYTAAWCSHNPANVAAHYEEHGSLRVNEGEPATGRKAIAATAQGFMNDFPDLQVSLDNLVFGDREVVYYWTLTGTNNGPGGTGQTVQISGYEVWQIGENGLIGNSEGHFDAEDYGRQLARALD